MKPSDQIMPQITAHRGASGDAPENTLAAIRLAAEQGATWVEIDVNISRDGVPVLHHDDSISRCSDGDGLVIERSLDQLRQVDSGTWFDPAFRGEPIATLDECLALCLELDLSINLEIKPSSGWEVPTTTVILETLAKHPTLPTIVLSSFSHLALQTAARINPALPRASLFVVAPSDWQTFTREIDACNIHLHSNSLLQREHVEAFHHAGLSVYCYTVNDAAEAASLLELGVDGVITNYPGKLLGQLAG
jgi:glycerophosphoryl diester phosphodiesterase